MLSMGYSGEGRKLYYTLYHRSQQSVSRKYALELLHVELWLGKFHWSLRVSWHCRHIIQAAKSISIDFQLWRRIRCGLYTDTKSISINFQLSVHIRCGLYTDIVMRKTSISTIYHWNEYPDRGNIRSSQRDLSSHIVSRFIKRQKIELHASV